MFIYTLGFLFVHSSLFRPIEFLALVIVLYAFLYFTAPDPEQTTGYPMNSGAKASFLVKLYAALQGEAPLSLVCWPYFLLINIILMTVDSLAVASNISVSSWDDILMFSISSSLIWLIVTWRCSAQTSHRSWAALARLATLCAFIDYALRILIRIQYPRAFFNCEEALLNYTSCF